MNKITIKKLIGIISCNYGDETIEVHLSPFGNCQIWSINGFKALINDDCSDLVEILLAIKKECGITKRLLQVDINNYVFHKIKDYVNIYSQLDYTNITGSKMTQLIIDLKEN